MTILTKVIDQYLPVVVYKAILNVSNFWVGGRNPKVWPFKMKATEQYFPVILFIMLFWLLSLWMESFNVTIQMEAVEQYFPVVVFIMLCKVVRLLSTWMKS